MAFCAVMSCSSVVGNQRFEGRATSINRVEIRDKGNVAIASLST